MMKRRSNTIRSNTIRSNTIRFPQYLLLVFMSFLVVQNSPANSSNSMVLLNPISVSSAITVSGISQKHNEPYIKRSGEVYLDAAAVFKSELVPSADNFSTKKSFKETRLLMSFFPESQITIIVDSESRPSDEVISLGGHQAGKEISTFSMTVTQKKYLITYQDLDNGLKYRIVGDVGTGIGQVVEIDLKKLPPAYDSEPLIPPGN